MQFLITLQCAGVRLEYLLAWYKPTSPTAVTITNILNSPNNSGENSIVFWFLKFIFCFVNYDKSNKDTKKIRNHQIYCLLKSLVASMALAALGSICLANETTRRRREMLITPCKAKPQLGVEASTLSPSAPRRVGCPKVALKPCLFFE